MIVQLAAALLLLAALWIVFRFAMGLRWAKLQREESRAGEERRGRSVVAELPQGEVVELFIADPTGFEWGGTRLGRQEIAGARLLLNGGVLAACARPQFTLPDPPPPEEPVGRERWEVVLYRRDGGVEAVPCGTVREGVSREAAHRVFAAVRAAVTEGP